MRLYLIRHGQTEWNTNGRAQGHTDIPLDATGLHQAALLGERFYNEPLEAVLTSDLQRAIQTAEPIADSTGARLEKLPALRERGFGDWEGKNFAEISAGLAASAQGRYDFAPPKGESFRQVWERIRPIADRLLRAKNPIAVVTHGGALSLLLAQLLAAQIEVSGSFRFANTSVTELGRLPDGRWHLAKYNDTRHLESIHDLENALVGSIDGSSR